MAIIHLQLPSTVDIIPSDHIHLCEDRAKSSATTENDIYGTPTVITKELPSGVQGWTLGAAYLPLVTVQAVISAYKQHTSLTLLDELGVSSAVVIQDYPTIERLKTASGDVTYSIKITIILQTAANPVPPVLSTTGSRLFGR